MLNSQEYDERRKAQAIEAFAHHSIRRQEEGRWLISQQYEDGAFKSIYWAEIVTLAGGGVLVHGDTDTCLFSGGSYREPRALLRWVGAHDDINYYLRQKARIGLGVQRYSAGLVDAFDTDVARSDIEEFKRVRLEELEDSGISSETDPILEIWREAPAHISDGQEVFHHWLYEELTSAGESDAYEYVSSIGKVTDSRVYYAWAAVRRLLELLKEQEEAADAEKK